MKSPTLHDVARLAGVSSATADRVLNRRGNVAEKSVRKVEEAVTQLGYVRNIAAANLSKKRGYHLAFVLPRRSHAFFGRMHEQLQKAALHLKSARVSIDVIEFEAFDIHALEAAVSGLSETDYDGVAFVGLGQEAALKSLEALRASGVKVVSLVSDGPKDCRDHYIGIDNEKAGRTAARLVGMAHAGNIGRVIVAAGSLDARDHSDRIKGFRAVLKRDFPNIEITSVIETMDQPRQMRELLSERLRNDDGNTAIYNVGAGNEGLVDAIRMNGRDGLSVCVVHELSTCTRDALEDGTIDVAIDQRPEIELNRALALLQAIVDDLPPPPAPELIPAIYLRDNLPNEPL